MLDTPTPQTNFILRLADHIENLPPGAYNQERFHNHDGTPACICAHAIHFSGEKNPLLYSDTGLGKQLLGLPDSMLFAATPMYHDNAGDLQALLHPTQKQAAKVLRHLALTGEVDWSIAANLERNVHEKARRSRPIDRLRELLSRYNYDSSSARAEAGTVRTTTGTDTFARQDASRRALEPTN